MIAEQVRGARWCRGGRCGGLRKVAAAAVGGGGSHAGSPAEQRDRLILGGRRCRGGAIGRRSLLRCPFLQRLNPAHPRRAAGRRWCLLKTSTRVLPGSCRRATCAVDTRWLPSWRRNGCCCAQRSRAPSILSPAPWAQPRVSQLYCVAVATSHPRGALLHSVMRRPANLLRCCWPCYFKAGKLRCSFIDRRP